MTAAARLQALQDATFASASAATAESLESSKRLDGAAIGLFLRNRQYATLATTRPDGRPHAAMTAFFAEDRDIWAPAMSGTQRVRNVMAEPWAVVVVADGEGEQHTMVTVEGPARVEAAAPTSILEGWVPKFGWQPDWAAAWVVVQVEKLRSYGADGSRYRTSES